MKVSIVDYNKTLFAKAGIASPPATWTALAADTAKLKALGVIPIGWKDSSAHILPALMSNGGTLLKGGNSVGTAVNFDSSAGRTTFSYFHSLYAAGELQLHHGTTLREDFAAGKMAMIDGTSAGYHKTLIGVGGKFPVGAFVEPAGSTGHATNLAQGFGFVLPKGHTHSQDEAALTFVKWWFEPVQQVRWAELTGYPPETRAGISAMPGSFLASHPGEAATIQAVESPYTVLRPVSDSYKEVQAALDTAFFDAVTGKTPVAAALAALQSRGDSYMSGASAI
ncbi:MAG: extracellular solute-binding protein [Acidimicrobiales bacterium]